MQLANPKLFLEAFADFRNPAITITIYLCSSLLLYVRPFVYLYVSTEYSYKTIIQ